LREASALRRLGRPDAASAILENLSELLELKHAGTCEALGEMGESEVWYERGLLEFARSRPERAESAFARAASGAFAADSHYSRALCLDRLGRYAEAASCLELATTIRPDFPEAWLQLGLLARYRLGDAPRARAAIGRYFALGGDDPELREWMEAAQ
jgi:tetratricopeptide (TPR) repeat protein